jgi:hypothetical protein
MYQKSRKVVSRIFVICIDYNFWHLRKNSYTNIFVSYTSNSIAGIIYDSIVNASKNTDIESCERLDIEIDILTKGAIIDSAFLYDVSEYKNLDEFNKDKQKHFSIHSNYYGGYKCLKYNLIE